MHSASGPCNRPESGYDRRADPRWRSRWPLPETSWLARTVLQSLIGVLLWPVVWALCFALFAVIGASAFTPGGSFGTQLVKPWVSVAALYVAFKAPQLLARQAMLAGLMPSPGSAAARARLRARGDARGRGGAGGARACPGASALGGDRGGGQAVRHVDLQAPRGEAAARRVLAGPWVQISAAGVAGGPLGVYLSPFPRGDDVRLDRRGRAAGRLVLRRDGP